MNSLQKHFLVLLLLLMIALVPATQFQGPVSHSSLPAPDLCVAEPMGGGDPSPAFVSSVGGVSFDQTARPGDELTINSIELGYSSSARDGERLQLRINSDKVICSLPDWLLLPVAKYADTRYYSCFTLFGSLHDKQKEEEVLDKGGRVMNYHPAFRNTLLGLRLYYLDILLLYPHVIYLPRDDAGRTLLGYGETEIDGYQCGRAFNQFADFLNNLQSEIGYPHRSWIITDYSRHIDIRVEDNCLQLTGEPYYFFWRFKNDKSDYNEIKEENRIREMLQAEKQEYVQNGQSERQWVFSKLVSSLNRYEKDYPLAFHGTVEEILQLQTDAQKLEFLELYDHDSLYDNLLIPLLVYMDAHQVEHLRQYSKAVSDRTDLIHGINPLVWDAATATMRYAAFFRYCKSANRTNWDHFIQQIDSVSFGPAAETPTVLFFNQE